mmetsp:Transcript_20802/g.44431  ORF Transcript_20802/g.44431 Transcript_20802/m.44431 type:complete len:408 (+) Transcript_20802:65-1288(+)
MTTNDPYGTFYNGSGTAPVLNASSEVPLPPVEPGRSFPAQSLLRSGKTTASHSVNVVELVLVPWLLMVVVLLSFLHGGAYGYYGSLVVIGAILLPLILLYIRYTYQQDRWTEVVLGILCLIASVIGLSVGSYAVLRSLSEYHRLSQGASYNNVLPDETGAGKLDATAITFTDWTFVDTSKSFGYVDIQQEAATKYCIAPISDGSSIQQRIQFWAVGVNCCQARSGFSCFANGQPSAHAGLVLPQDSHQSAGFKVAVRGALAAYDLTAGDNYLLVEWHEDPVAYRKGLYDNTVMLFNILGGVYFLISAMVACAVYPVLSPKAAASPAGELGFSTMSASGAPGDIYSNNGGGTAGQAVPMKGGEAPRLTHQNLGVVETNLEAGLIPQSAAETQPLKSKKPARFRKNDCC